MAQRYVGPERREHDVLSQPPLATTMASPVMPPAHSLIRNLPLPWRLPWRTPIFRLPPRAFASKHPQRAGGKPPVLEKPARFNPPSHGSRLPSGKGPPRHYGGPVSEIEIKAQARRDYPGLPPPPGSFAHMFWNSPRLHAWITIVSLLLFFFFPFLASTTCGAFWGCASE